MKHKNDLAILQMSEEEAITIYNLSVVVPSLFGGIITTKSDIAYLPTYVNWRYKSLWTGLVYDLEKILDTVHRYIKLFIGDKYQRHLALKSLATEMDLRLVEFVLVLFCCVDDKYMSLSLLEENPSKMCGGLPTG